MTTKTEISILAGALLFAGASFVSAADCSGKNSGNWPTSRNAKEWPFAQDSIWNMPIGCNARYVDAKLDIPDLVDLDIDLFFTTSNSDPVVPVFKAGGQLGGGTKDNIYGLSTNRCSGSVDIRNYQRTTSSQNAFSVRFPANEIISTKGKNYSTAILMPDGVNIRQLNAFARCSNGGPIYGLNSSFAECQESIFGGGNQCYGGHGGTGLSSIGGALRASDFSEDGPIRHALKVNLSEMQFYLDRGRGSCEPRWPAKSCDNHPVKYGETNLASSHVPANKMGALLALPPGLTPEKLGIATAAGRKMFDVLQDYGVYTVDGSGSSTTTIRNTFSATKDGEAAFERRYGFPFQVGEQVGGQAASWKQDMQKILANLHVVDDNAAGNVGGSGSQRRRPLAPGFGTGGGGNTGGDPNTSPPQPPMLLDVTSQ